MTCLRGASAVQKILEERREKPLHVFVVWEPVIVTDLGPPSAKTLALVADPRVVQFWDRGRHLSHTIFASARHDPKVLGWEVEGEEEIVWDWAASFPAGTTWDEGTFPSPTFATCPVVGDLPGLRAAL